MKTILLLLLTTIVAFSQDTVIDERSGVPIIFSAEGKIFPDSWYKQKTKSIGISLSPQEYERSAKVVSAAIKKYPVSVIKKNLENIYVLSDLIFFDQSFGGTNSRNAVYLSNKGIAKGYTDQYLEQLFHAEFSSILLRNYKDLFDEAEWIQGNPASFSYGKGGVEALKTKQASERFDEELNRSGFINSYATSSLENDFNAFAKNLFAPSKGFKSLVETHPKLHRKRMLIIGFYTRLNYTWTEDYFNKILSLSK
jgi:hypothetical protein